MKTTSIWVACLLFGMSMPTLHAAAAPKVQSPTSARDAGPDVSRGTAVVYPVIFDKSGTRTSHQAAVGAIRDVLQTAGYTLISETVAQNAWQGLHFMTPTTVYPVRLDDLVRFGKLVHADYVVSGQFHFRSRSKWVDLGPKTISTATADLIVIDVNQNKLVYHKLGTARSDARGKVTDLAPLATLTPPVQPMISGGPKTPHEQRAAEMAVAVAMKDWLKKEREDDHEM